MMNGIKKGIIRSPLKKHKFILCIEGNDVASNLKWVMSSNSVAVMPKPKFESWFMEKYALYLIIITFT